MKYSTNGHVVTINSVKYNNSPSISAQCEMNELINHLSGDQQSAFLSNLFGSGKIRLTTVLWKQESFTNQFSDSSQYDKRMCSIKNVSESILDSIRADRTVLYINQDKSLMHNIFKIFRK